MIVSPIPASKQRCVLGEAIAKSCTWIVVGITVVIVTRPGTEAATC